MSVDSCPVRWSGWQAVVALPDEIDMTNAGQVREALARSLEDGATVLVADMTAATFCAAEGVRALLRGHVWAREAGAELRVAALSPPVRRVVELTAADHVLHIYPSVAAALAGPDGANDLAPKTVPEDRDDSCGQMEPVLSASQSFRSRRRG